MTDEARFQQTFKVSRETMNRLSVLHDILLKWNGRINLVSRGSEQSAWSRHFADSAQLWLLRTPAARSWADLGAGAGFPGLVIAAFAANAGTDVALVDSNLRKCVFLREAARNMGVAVTVHQTRIEALPPLHADILSARALAPLNRLLGYVEKHRNPQGRGLFPKGHTVHKEVETATRSWRFEHRLHPSLTDPGAAIVEVGAVSRV